MILFLLAIGVSLLLLPVCFVQVLYLESMRLRSRDTASLEYFKDHIEERIGLKTEQGALAFSLIKHALLLNLAILIFASIEHAAPKLNVPVQPLWRSLLEAMAFSAVAMVFISFLLPQLFYRRTQGRWLSASVPLLRLFARASTPLLALLNFMKSVADLSNPEEPEEETTSPSEDIAALIDAGAEEGLIQEDDKKLIQSVVEFGGKTVRQVMTPRPNIVAISEDATLADLHKLVVQEQYSRIPTYRGTVDHITGFVHVRDMLQMDSGERALRHVREILRPVTHVPETKPVDDLLRLMQKEGAHMVVVVDEYGNTAGLATMEDLVEEIVGEISDEHDPNRDTSLQPDGSYLVSGNFDLDHLNELFQYRPEEGTESTTVGGLVTEWLGHVPKPGEAVEREGIRIEVVAADSRRVSQLRLMKPLVAPVAGAEPSTPQIEHEEKEQ